MGLSQLPDDEFNDLNAAGPSQLRTPKPSAQDDLAVEWGDKELIKREGLEAIQPTKDRSARFWIIPGYKPVAAHTHFLEGSGKGKGATYRCLATGDDRSVCPACTRGIRRDLRVVAPVAHYLNADASGKLATDVTPSIAIKFVRLSRANYAAISELAPEDAGIADIDLIMFNDPARPIGYSFKAAQCRIRQHHNEGAVADLARVAMADPKALTSKLGKVATPAELRAALGDREEEAVLEDLDEEM